MRNKVLKIIKVFSIGLGSVLLVLTGLVLSLQFSSVQNFVKNKAISYLTKKLDTEISLDKIYVSFPNDIVLEKFYIKGKDVDTLLFVDQLNVGIYLPDLIKSKANISSIDLDGIDANINRNKDSKFNFEFILDAFATENDEDKDSKPFIISLDKIELKNIGVVFNDDVSKNDFKIHLKEFKTTVKTFDLQENNYAINSILIDGFKFSFDQKLVDKIVETTDVQSETSIDSKPLKINLGEIQLKNFDIAYSDENSKMNAHVIFENFYTYIKNIDLENNQYEIDKVSLSDATIDFSMFSKKENTIESPVKNKETTSNNDLNVLLNQLKLANVSVNYNDDSVKPTNQGLDFNHLKFSEINLNLNNFSFNENHIKGFVSEANLKEKRGLQIDAFTTHFNYAQETAYLKDLYLKTPKSLIRDSFVLEYQSQSELSSNIENVKIVANLPNVKLAFSDVLLLVPTLKNTPPFNTFPNSILSIDSKVSGKLNDLNIHKLIVSGLGNSRINANGIVKNAMNPSQLWVNLHVNNLSSSATDINRLVPKETIPDNIQLPQNFTLLGSVKGNINTISADLKLKSTIGNADLKALLNQQKKDFEIYAIDANIYNFNVGKLIKNDSLGEISASLKLSGKSLNFENADAEVVAEISSAKFKSYIYKNFNLNGNIKKGLFDITAKMNDENVIFDINAIGKYTEEAPSLNLVGEITKIDLYKTGFADDTFAIAGKTEAYFTNLNPNNLNGNLSLHDFAIAYKDDVYPITNADFYAFSDAEKNQVSFQSQVFNVNVTGKYKLTELPIHLQRTINSYFNLNLSEEVLNKKLDPAFFDTSFLIKNDDLLTKFLPDLERFKDIELVGYFNSDNNKISLKSNISELIYGTNVLSGINLNLENNVDELQYDFSILGLENQSFQLNKASLSGQVKNSSIGYDLRVRDIKDVIKYELSGTFSSLKDRFQVTLNPNGLKLNYEDWNVNNENYIQISDKGILAHDFEVSHKGSKIHVDSEEDIPNSPLNFDIDDFAIETLTEMIKKDTMLLASGIINGKAQINDLKNKMTFTSDLNIAKLNVLGSNVGNLQVNVDNESENKLSANVQLTGYDNQVNAIGFYETDNESFDLDVEVSQIQMKSLQGFSQQMISDTKGFISGDLKITGNTEKPSILGDVKFNGASLHINSLNATFTKIDDKISFTKEGILFDNFSISDTDNNVLSLNGNILTNTYRDFRFNLSVFGQGFNLVNSTNSGDDILYGNAALDVNLNIRGNLNLPKVSGNLKVTNQTDFTFVMPQYSPALQEREGIIEFVDQDQMVLEKTIIKDEEITNSEITGLDVSVNIEVDKDAKIAIVLDKLNNDVVKIQGEAQLTGGIDPSGKTTLIGTYEVNQGSYDMSVNFIKRKFDIQKRSTIIWNGEPTKADVNLTAIYKLKTAPLDLVQQQLNSDASQDLNLYKQKLPFETLLIIKGELLKPDISFNIELDEDNANVSSEVLSTVKSKLEQLRNEESELNKQVLALLLLNRFISENPFETNVNISASSMARQSVSKLLSQQLNSLASNLITGVDINFDLESQDDYSTGDKNVRTDLNIGVSKSLFNDRLKVSVGSNFGLEGEARENEQTNNIAGDVTVEYKLSKNGRYTLRAYRVNEYQVALQGEVVETGLGFIITLDYNKFREILSNKTKEQNTRRNQLNKANNESK